MKKWAFIFPGQGAQYVGMGKDFAEAFSIAKETFQEADDVLGRFLSKVIFEGPEDLLTETKNAQAAIFVTSLAILRTMQTQFSSLVPFAAAGLSLGEYSALCAAKKLGFRETLLLLQKRAEFMQEACEKTKGTMAAVLGLEDQAIEKALHGVAGVFVANYNCPGQVVISGTFEGVEKGSAILKEQGAKRVIPLSVSGAFHSGLMQSAEEALTPFILRAKLAKSPIHLVMNAVGDVVDSTEEIQKYLISQITHSVRWSQGILSMQKAGVEEYLEIGCGKTLSGMNRKIGVLGKTLSIEKVQDLDLFAEHLSGTKGTSCNC